jgi:twinkle protein
MIMSNVTPTMGDCPACGSSDANATYPDDGHSWCYSCQTYTSGDKSMQQTKVIPMSNPATSELKSVGHVSDIPDRKIKQETARKYNTQVMQSGNMITHHIYQYFDKDGNHIANKVREVQGKKFWSEGNLAGSGLFGEHIFGRPGKYITVCEGEIDAMSAYEMLGSKWPVVSIKNGAASALENCRKSFEYLNQFENVVLCFDNDKPGKEAALKVAELFDPNKCKIIELDLKDANEYLKTNQRKKFSDDWWNARTFTPAGIVNLADLGASLYDEKYCETVLYPWQGLNDKTYGMRTGELVTFTSGAGMGKSSIIRELMHHIMRVSKDNIGVLAMEESIRNTAFNLMSVEADARLYIKEIRDKFTREQLTDWQDKTIGTGRFFAFDHFGSISNDEILGRVRYMASGLGCKWVILDHLSILVSGQEDNGDERKSIDILMTKLRSLVEATGIGLLLVSHLRRPSGDRGHEDGREVSLSHLRGSASIAHLSDSVIALERNQQAEDEVEANTTVLRILKNRYTGDTGICTHLHYDKETGRMTEINNPFEAEEDTDVQL